MPALMCTIFFDTTDAARFAAEPRSIHPHWWDGSSQVLGLNEDASPDAMFGVTPAIISTMGALVTTALIRERFKNSNWGQVWIEFKNFALKSLL